MSRRARTSVFVVAAAAVGVLLVWAYAGLPSFGDFHGKLGELLGRLAVPQRHATDTVATVTFDYRGFDTFGEGLILFTSAIGVLVLLRIHRRDDEVPAERGEGRPTASSASVRSIAVALAGPFLLLGIYVVTHGQLTPGGGFQGGVVLMSSLLLIYLGGARLSLGRMSPLEGMELAHGVGAAGFGLIGLGGLVLAGAFMQNFLPFGTVGSLLSGGDIPLYNISVGLEVMGAVLVILGELLDQRLLGGSGS